MISIDRLRSVTDVFFHQNCADGTAAAAICAEAFKLLGMSPKFRPLQYGTGFMDRLEPRPGQLFVDITPPKARWREWEAVSPVVLDHHETVREVTEGLGGVYRTNDAHSGAMVAYEEVLLPVLMEDPEKSIRSVEDRDRLIGAWSRFATLAMTYDTWKDKSPDWDEARVQVAAMDLFGARTVVEKVQDGTFSMEAAAAVGRVLFDKAQRKIEFIAKNAERSEVLVQGETVRVATFNCTEKLISDAANLLISQGANVVAGYFYTVEDGAPKLCVSLRSDATRSARRIAELYGGGGHDRASGFNIPSAAPSRIVEMISGALWKLAKE